jgi:hypothetical protein
VQFVVKVCFDSWQKAKIARAIQGFTTSKTRNYSTYRKGIPIPNTAIYNKPEK